MALHTAHKSSAGQPAAQRQLSGAAPRIGLHITAAARRDTFNCSEMYQIKPVVLWGSLGAHITPAAGAAVSLKCAGAEKPKVGTIATAAARAGTCQQSLAVLGGSFPNSVVPFSQS